MATVTGLTATRMLEIEASSIVDGEIDQSGNLILTTHGGTNINAGHVVGISGEDGESVTMWVGTDPPVDPTTELWYDEDALAPVMVPVGMLAPFAGSTSPNGWLLCDGTAISRISYANLFEVIGSVYGNGDGSTTFNVPDLKGRIPVGLDIGQIDFNNLGEKGGQLIHSHPLSDLGIACLLIAASPSPNIFERRISLSNSWTATHSNGFASGAASNTTVTTVGAGLMGRTDDDVNLQPYITMSYIIKV